MARTKKPDVLITRKHPLTIDSIYAYPISEMTILGPLCKIPKLPLNTSFCYGKVIYLYLLHKTNNMTQTAVEWLIDQLKERGYAGEFPPHLLFEQAKEMEKQQITDAHIEGQRVFDKHPHTQWTNDQAEQYYNETFKQD